MDNQRELGFSKLFPFYFTIDKDWNITSAGPSFLKRFPSLIGKQFKNEYTIVSPKYLNEAEDYRKLEDKLIIIKLKDSNLIFRGQFINLDNLLYFSWSPWINKMEELKENNISISDFSLSDNTVDLLQLVQLQNQAVQDLNKLNDLVHKKNNDLIAYQLRLQRIIQSSSDIIFELNADLMCTELYLKDDSVLVIPREGYVGKYLMDVFPGEFGEMIKDNITKAIKSKSPVEIEFISTVTGLWNRAQINSFELDGEITIIVSTRIIEEKKQKDLEIQTSNARLKAIVSHMNTGGVLLENQQREIVLVNKTFCDLFSINVNPEYLVGADCSNSAKEASVLFKNPEQFISRITEILEKRETVNNEILEMIDGRIIERNYIPVFSNDLYVGHLWKYADVTARTKAINVLRITKEKYEGIIENMGLGYLEVDINRIIKKTNKRMLEILDYKNESDLIDKIAPDILLPKDKKSLQQIDEWKKGKSSVLEVNMKKSNDSIVPNLISGGPLYDSNKNIVGSISMHLDITKQKAAENELKKQTELALKSVEAKQSFISNMSHEIRTPLNAIANSIELLKKSGIPKGEIDYVEIIQNASKSLSFIVNDILDLAKIENGKIELEERPFSLSKLMKELFSLHKLSTDKKNILFSVNIDNNIPDELVGDEIRLSQVINNLVSNAIKFTDAGGVNINAVLMKLGKNRVYINFEVVDTGSGISKEYLKNLFEPFSQEDTTVTRKYGGTGLGLTISKKFIELMGSKLSVESEKNVGSKFSFIIPFILVKKEKIGSPKRRKINTEKLKETTILLVDDNLVNRVLTMELLKKTVKEVIDFDGAQKVIDYLTDKKHPKNTIILMDLQMPEIDGIKASKIIRKNISLNIPIIGVSANAFTTHIKIATKAGMNDYISKPFDIGELLEKISNQLKKPHAFHYYNRIGLLNQIGNDKSIEKTVCKSFIQIIENKWQLLTDCFIANNHKQFRAVLHEITPSIKMFITDEYLGLFLSIVQHSKTSLSNIDEEDLQTFQKTIAAAIKEMKEFAK